MTLLSKAASPVGHLDMTLAIAIRFVAKCHVANLYRILTFPPSDSCSSAGYSRCCQADNRNCRGSPPSTCFCDAVCQAFEDCCSDIFSTCSPGIPLFTSMSLLLWIHSWSRNLCSVFHCLHLILGSKYFLAWGNEGSRIANDYTFFMESSWLYALLLMIMLLLFSLWCCTTDTRWQPLFGQ